MRLKLTTLTPLHIGNGQKWYPFEYWANEDKQILICIGNFDNFSDFILKGDKWEENYKKLIGLIEKNIKNNRLDISFVGILKEFGLADKNSIIKRNFIKKLMNCNPSLISEIKSLKKEIDQFVCHPDNSLFIPGSSIKGAIRTALLHNKLKSNLDIKRIYDDKNFLKEFQFISHNDPENIHVADVELAKMRSRLEIVKRIGMEQKDDKKVWNPKKDEKEAGLNGVEIVEIADGDNVYANMNSKLEFGKIKEAADNFYIESIGKVLEIECVKKNDELSKQLSGIIQRIEGDDNSIFLQLGKYGDYFTKSLGGLIKNEAIANELDDQNLTRLREIYNFGKIPKLKKFGKIFPKTFSVTSDNKPFGWVKLTLEEQ